MCLLSRTGELELPLVAGSSGACSFWTVKTVFKSNNPLELFLKLIQIVFILAGI